LSDNFTKPKVNVSTFDQLLLFYSTPLVLVRCFTEQISSSNSLVGQD